MPRWLLGEQFGSLVTITQAMRTRLRTRNDHASDQDAYCVYNVGLVPDCTFGQVQTTCSIA
jgi:hypothetical protein